MKKLSKSIVEYLANSGWSSSLFLEHAKVLFADEQIAKVATVEVGRSVVYLRGAGRLLKAYVHYKGRTKEFLSLVDENGREYSVWRYTDRVEDIKSSILTYFCAN